MTVMDDPLNTGNKMIVCHYKLDAPIELLYPPKLSNSRQYRAASKALYRKLSAKNLLTSFHEQMEKSIREKHAVMIPLSEHEQFLAKNPHCFSGINYALKESGNHQVRLVTNSSSNHASGSVNSHLCKGPNFLSSLKTIFHKFCFFAWAIMLDLSRAYRSLHSTDESNNLRLMWRVQDLQSAKVDVDASLQALPRHIRRYAGKCPPGDGPTVDNSPVLQNISMQALIGWREIC